MDKLSYLLLSSMLLILFSCGNQKDKTSIQSNATESSQVENVDQQFGRTNYAVVWKWATNNIKLVENNNPQISKELINLWKKGVVENAYFDTDSPTDKLDYFGNITFVLKAKDKTDAKDILDRLTVVKKGIATYQLFPVGQLWLDRKTELINEQGITKSFVAVWNTQKSPLDKTKADLLKSQNDMILDLWNKGKVENIYFDIEGTQKENEKTDFVFFVNANSEMDAKSICEALPFYQEKIANYELFQVGVFWMGKYEDM
jgi:hypothetical protein